MTMTYDPLAYEMPWRPNYEMSAVFGWVAASVGALAVQQITDMPPEPFYWMTGICGVMTMARLPKAIKLHLLQKHLKGRDLSSFPSRSSRRRFRPPRGYVAWIWFRFGKTAMRSAFSRS